MKVLQLSPCPIIKPMHGGQIRISQIREKLQSLNCEVLSLSISEHYYPVYHPKNDLVVDIGAYPNPYKSSFCGDILTATLCSTQKNIYDFFENHIKTFKPDIIFLEQPWLWPVIKRMIAKGLLAREKIYLVYSTQNVESQVKKSILTKINLELDCVYLEKAISDIEDLEQELVAEVDEVICVTKDDADFFKTNKNKKISIMPNGVIRRKVLPELIKKIEQVLAGRRFLFFAGSAYPPNAIGFWEMLGPSLATFPPDCMIIAVGGIHEIIMHFAPQESEMFSLVNSTILKCVGRVEEEVLAALIVCAHGIILPITFGGGSNLKTAEAIAANKPVVATSVACRGFDFVNELSNFYIADNTHDFSTTAQRILMDQLPLTEISPNEAVLRDSVYWDHALEGLSELLDNAKLKLFNRN